MYCNNIMYINNLIQVPIDRKLYLRMKIKYFSIRIKYCSKYLISLQGLHRFQRKP
jgi:hypothetical protein